MKGYRLIYAAIIATAGVVANATQYTFTPPSSDLFDLDHSKAYAWGLMPNIPTNETIISAKLTITDIYDWTQESNLLTIDVLNNPPSFGTSTTTGTATNYIVTKDDSQEGKAYWETQGSWGGWQQMYKWSDSDGPTTHNTLVYDFNSLYVYDQSGTHLQQTIPGGGAGLSALNQYIKNDGLFGIAFDPDCHFYNSGVKLQIETGPSGGSVPGPLAAIPFVTGLFVALRRKR